MEERSYRPSLIGPLILITAGVLLLLNQAGRLPWSVWGTLWRFWPIVLILIGIDVLVKGSRSLAVYVIGLLIALAVLGGVIGYAVHQSGQAARPWMAMSADTVLEQRQDADRGDIRLRFGAGRLAIGALSDSPSFVEGKIEYGRYSRKAEKAFRVTSGRAVFSLEAQTPSFPRSVPGPDIGDRWDLKFTPRIPLDMNIEGGVGKVEMDLSDLQVTKLGLKVGVGETIITLPTAAEHCSASVEAAVGSIAVRIPDAVGARISVSRALCSLRVDERFVRSVDTYVSTNYDTAGNTIELEIACAVGSITIQ